MAQQINTTTKEAPPDQLKSILEAILFVSSETITIEQFCQIIDGASSKQIKGELTKLTKEYQESGRSFQLTEIANGYQITTHPEYHYWVSKFHTKQVRVKLTPAALEALAIVAYKQPVTRTDVEAVRGVNSDSVLNSLLEKDSSEFPAGHQIQAGLSNSKPPINSLTNSVSRIYQTYHQQKKFSSFYSPINISHFSIDE